VTTVACNLIYGKLGAECPHFPFAGKAGINVYLEDPNNPWNIFSCFIHQTLWK
jgi:hypothetical protein